MKKTTMVKKIIGEVVEPLGFSYVKEESSWCFYREKTDIVQQINIDDFYKESLRLIFMTTAYGQRPIEETDLVPEKDYQGNILGQHGYETEEEFKTIIEGFREVIIKYGLDALSRV